MNEGNVQETMAFRSQNVNQYPVQQPIQIAVQQPMQYAVPNQIQYVVQNPVQPKVQLHAQNDQAAPTTRWLYGYFGVAVALYHGVWTILWLIAWFIGAAIGVDGYGALFFWCGFIPSFLCFIWLIMDSTVLCCNSSGSRVNICCCPCFHNGKWAMVLPMAIATFLRCILYIVLFGITADILMSFGEEKAIDNVFFIILTYAAFDAGPLILLTVDWYYYYSGSDGIFGKETNPMRCVVGQSAVLFVISWSFIAVFQEYADNALEFIWPWLLHGIISTAALMFCALIQCNGIVTGIQLSSPCFLTVSKVMAAAMGIAVIAVLIFTIEAIVYGDGFIPPFVFVIYLYYYTALSVPSVMAMASFKSPEAAQARMKQVMGPKDGKSAVVACEMREF